MQSVVNNKRDFRAEWLISQVSQASSISLIDEKIGDPGRIRQNRPINVCAEDMSEKPGVSKRRLARAGMTAAPHIPRILGIYGTDPNFENCAKGN